MIGCLCGSDKRTTWEALKRLENRGFNEKGQRSTLAFLRLPSVPTLTSGKQTPRRN